MKNQAARLQLFLKKLVFSHEDKNLDGDHHLLHRCDNSPSEGKCSIHPHISGMAICTKLGWDVDVASVGGGRGETSHLHRTC